MVGPPRQRTRGVYIHDPTAENVSTASTAQGQRIRSERNAAPPPSPEKRQRRTNHPFDVALGYGGNYRGDDVEMELETGPAEGPAGIKVKKKGKKAPRNLESDRPLLPFIPERNAFMDGLVRREGRGPWWSKGCMATNCLALEADYRCEDCFGGRLLCRSCIVERHRDEPLHLIQRWLDDWFQRCTLTSLDPSMRFQLGHRPGEDCDFRNAQKFVVLDNNAIHELQVDFCGCLGAPSVREQLLNIGWFPATRTSKNQHISVWLVNQDYYPPNQEA
ncbi:hypothetical protein B0H15DRAFT_954377 [Mycena belliarum]|uniref:CxC2-like cysteine cluster KDZ transposase-associated domain-containing protein n=1 Tax=Mycena belliarum TaxID=1033014 RepID=A0AAD6XPH5_9AGAR|nr:hypothetical protein B0H15DRAFT_954377 [Mycena belliae]